jgi:cytochrome c-type biogenesis protein CcmF
LFSAGAATGLGVASALSGIRHPLWFAIVWLAWFAVAALLAGLAIECWNNRTRGLAASLGRLLLARRNSLAGFTIHLGLAALAVGVTGSSLCSQRTEVVMKPGDVRAWNGQTIRFERLEETDYADKHVVAAALQIERPNARPIFLFPAQHYHWLQSQWTTEVAIHSTWQSDLYAILHQGEKDGGIRLTLLLNPMMRWLWAGGTVMVLGAGLRLAPALLLGWRRASMPLRGRGTVPLVRSHPGLSDAPNSSPLRSGSRRRSA